MGYTQATKTIHASAEVVWNTLNDIDNTPKWVTGLENAEVITAGVFGKDTIYVDYNRLGWMLQVTPWHITEFEPIRRQVHVSESANLPSTMTLTLSERADGTQVMFTVEYRFMPHWGAVSRLFERLVMNHLLKGVLKQNLDGLDAYLQEKAQIPQVIANKI